MQSSQSLLLLSEWAHRNATSIGLSALPSISRMLSESHLKLPNVIPGGGLSLPKRVDLTFAIFSYRDGEVVLAKALLIPLVKSK